MIFSCDAWSEFCGCAFPVHLYHRGPVQDLAVVVMVALLGNAGAQVDGVSSQMASAYRWL